jgi:Cro/C1-type HTH DNA-binding domain
MGKLHRATDVSYKTIKRIYSDPFYATTTITLGKLAKVLGVPPGELKDTIYYLQDAAKYLEKTGLEDLKGIRTIEGQVIGLSYDGQGTREIVVLADGIGKVEMVLDEQAYQLAGQVHLNEIVYLLPA